MASAAATTALQTVTNMEIGWSRNFSGAHISTVCGSMKNDLLYFFILCESQMFSFIREDCIL